MIRLEDVTKSYMTLNGRFVVFRNLSLDVPEGVNVGLIGRNDLPLLDTGRDHREGHGESHLDPGRFGQTPPDHREGGEHEELEHESRGEEHRSHGPTVGNAHRSRAFAFSVPTFALGSRQRTHSHGRTGPWTP